MSFMSDMQDIVAHIEADSLPNTVSKNLPQTPCIPPLRGVQSNHQQEEQATCGRKGIMSTNVIYISTNELIEKLDRYHDSIGRYPAMRECLVHRMNRIERELQRRFA